MRKQKFERDLKKQILKWPKHSYTGNPGKKENPKEMSKYKITKTELNEQTTNL